MKNKFFKVLILVVFVLVGSFYLGLNNKAYSTSTSIITATAGAGGSISPSGIKYVNWRAEQTYTIIPAPSFYILDVIVDGSSIGPESSYTFQNVVTNHTISATFSDVFAVPTVTTNPVTDITETTAIVGASVDDASGGLGGLNSGGFVWDINENPTLETSIGMAWGGVTEVHIFPGPSSFASQMTELQPDTLYHVRAFFIPFLNRGVFYGNDVTFKTCSVGTIWNGTTCVASVTPSPDLTAKAVTPTKAVPGVSKTFSSTISNIGDKSVSGSISHLFQLDNDEDHTSGVTTNTVTSTSSIAEDGGNITVSQSYKFTAGTKYIRVCADNNASFVSAVPEANNITPPNPPGGSIPPGTGEMNNCSFDLNGDAFGWTKVIVNNLTSIPAVATNPLCSDITINSLTSGGNVISDGGAAITARGVAYNKIGGAPTILNKHTTELGTAGPFTSKITGLTPPGTLYQIRAYATNSVGTGYGSLVKCITRPLSPDLTAGATSPTTATRGVQFNLIATVLNIGTAPVGKEFSNFFQVANRPVDPATNAPVAGATIDDLSPSTMGNIPANLSDIAQKSHSFSSSGSYSVRVCADKASSIDGGSVPEANNITPPNPPGGPIPPGTGEMNNCGPWTNINVGNTSASGACSSPAEHYKCAPGSISENNKENDNSWTCRGSLSGESCSEDKKGKTTRKRIPGYEFLDITIVGAGTVALDPTGVNDCGIYCYQFPSGTTVKLSASPSSSFFSWSEDCSGTNPSTSIQMNGDKKCTATFSVVGGACGATPKHYFCADGKDVGGTSETQQWVWFCGGERCVEQKKAPWYYED